MQNYNEVPNILTGKDLDYLSDIFTWNYTAYKKNLNNKENVQDEEISQLINEATSTFYNNLTKVLNILSEGGENE